MSPALQVAGFVGLEIAVVVHIGSAETHVASQAVLAATQQG